MACSRVWPPRSNPVSNSPLRAEMTRIPISASEAPVIMLGTKLLWPGASMIVKRFFSEAKWARPH